MRNLLVVAIVVVLVGCKSEDKSAAPPETRARGSSDAEQTATDPGAPPKGEPTGSASDRQAEGESPEVAKLKVPPSEMTAQATDDNALQRAGLTPPLAAGSAGSATTKPVEKKKPRTPAEMTALEKQASAYAEMLVGRSDDAIQGDMSKRSPGASLDQQIANVRDGDSRVGVGTNSREARAGVGAGPIDTTRPAPGPSGRVSIASKQALDDTTLTVAVVLAKIQSAYVAGVKRCYKSRLQVDPTRRGRVRLAIQVTASGRAGSSTIAKGFDGDLDRCVTAMMMSWRFPIPKDKDGEATDAGFTIDLQLVPD